MPAKRKPAYSLHKSTGQARVRIEGKDHYLGQYGSAESRERYDDLIAEWCRSNGDTRGYTMTVDELALAYLEHAKQHYRKNGQPTSELNCARSALRHLIKVHGPTRVRAFGPRALKAVRQSMIEAGLVRSSINIHIGRIRRVFKWGVAEELVPPEILIGLQAVTGLRAGRSNAVESEPVRPVPIEFVNAIEPFVSRTVWGLIWFQLHTGARPGEAMRLRGCDLNMSGPVWEYTPDSHKTEHHGKTRILFIGPQGQAVVREFLRPDLHAYLFSPKDAIVDHIRAHYRNGARTDRKGNHAPGEHYTRHSYYKAIERACGRANVPRWHPNQLRHNAGTLIRRHYGIEAARIVLGHSSAVTTEIYAERDFERAREIMQQVG